jgi:hypothetical protein
MPASVAVLRLLSLERLSTRLTDELAMLRQRRNHRLKL